MTESLSNGEKTGESVENKHDNSQPEENESSEDGWGFQ